ncbi:MAG: hypothetical protein H0U74_04865, partial [Bradymonadaceae bacterium]|nr:hypothetical protein [Lujinxingiaceae bacterium]
MMTTADAKLIARIDAALNSERALGQAVDEVITLLSPASTELWPHLLVVLHALEQPRLAAALVASALPDTQLEALAGALQAVAPLIGPRPVGPLHIQVARTRQRFDAELRKHALVTGRLQAGVAAAEANRMLAAYLDTDAAPLFIALLRQSHPRQLEAAEQSREQQLLLLVADPALLALLAMDAGSPDELAAKLRPMLQALATGLTNTPQTLVRALQGGDSAARQVACALVAYLRLHDLVPNLLSLVLTDSPCAPQAAVIAAQLSPEMARQTFSELLVDMVFGNPEDPDMAVTAQ